jgi:cell division septal protein FtsQ
LIFFFLIGYVLFSIKQQLFLIQDIQCTQDSHSCDEPITAEFQKLKGHLLFSPDIEKTTEKVTKAVGNISSISVTKTFPHKLQIDIKTTQPILFYDCEGELTGIDEHLQIIRNSRSSQENIPKLPLSKEMCDDLVKDATPLLQYVPVFRAFLQQVSQEKPETRFLWENSSTFIIYWSDQQRILFSPPELAQEWQALPLVLEYPELPENWKEIDLRFQKAVIR